MPTQTSILIWRGEPLDFSEYRHTALFFKFPDGSNTVLQIEGTPGIFELVKVDGYQPDYSQNLERNIPVAQIPDSFGAAMIRTVIANTAIKNGPEYRDWNCQSWVSDALVRMVASGFLSDSARKNALDQMTDVLLEATDE
ncbi:hypothetical protein N7492_010375 [Penicillium capsulatum]|uniref:Uncharacterized protein n=1 Tax=Penicillium capsulatum TaxID=69766 RepID=A0A9W9HNY9_9EURO|nr:hypothetical protein N7492_010375 [Penicillium capsulatum]KAJ6112879.1 hypothetical protein N7512_008203 [Penicillium capsulatum]